jgi:transcriptional regulator with XRE-family HTH domain
VRAARGISQVRLAELLCASAGLPTITRHEISRWEREERVPGAYWLRWLARALEVPTDELERAATATRARRAPLSLHPPDPGRGDLVRLAHTWLAAPGDLALPTGLATATGLAPAGRRRRSDRVPAPDALDGLDARLRDLRRMDDLVGGADLADTVERELRAALALLPEGAFARRGRPARRRLGLIAQLAQLAGWTAADADRARAAVCAYRIALAAAEAAGDRALGAHVLGCLSHLVAPRDPGQGLLLARTAHAGVRAAGPASVRALLAHRVAFAAALAGEHRASEEALAAAQRLAERRVASPRDHRNDREPDWLYWLDQAELIALTGRCFAVLGRPLRAEPLLRRRLDRAGACGPRTAALDGALLARAYLDAGEVEQAYAAAGRALVAAVRSGSPRAAARALAPAARLTEAAAARAGRAHREYAELLIATRPYLPVAGRADGPGRRIA